jgi:ATP-binding cassette, subfamily B, heavy metal transporter
MMPSMTHAAVLRTALILLWKELGTALKLRLLLAVLLTCGSAFLAAVSPLAFKWLLDGFAAPDPVGGYFYAMTLIGAYVVVQMLSRAFGELTTLIQGIGDQGIQRRLSHRLFTHILKLPLRLHLDRASGAVGQTLVQGLLGYQSLIGQAVFAVLPVVVQLATMCAVLFRIGHPVYLGILALAAVGYVIAFGMGAARIRGPVAAATAAQRDAHGFLTDSLLNYETVKYFNSEDHVSRRYDEALHETEFHWRRFYNSRVANGLLVIAVFAASLGASLFFAGHEVMQGRMTVGEFVLINTYVVQLMMPLETIGHVYREMSQSVVSIQKMLEILIEPPEPDRPRVPGEPIAIEGSLHFDRVGFSYEGGRRVLADVSFSVPPGKSLAVVGLSGSGKSTLIRLLFRLYPVESGRIELDGHPIDALSLATLRQSIAVVPQDTVLFNDTIGRNIAFGRPGSTQEEIEAAARLARLHDFVMTLPEGYATRVGERGIKLSGGEKQRVSIARAALKRPSIFVFDEATSSLDSRTERDILQNLHEISRSSTTLIIAHRLATVVHADEIVVLEGGRIVERGAHASLLRAHGRYAALWNAQSQGAVAA